MNPEQLGGWRKGVEPCRGVMHSIFRLAARMTWGLESPIGEGFQMTLSRMDS